MSKFWVFGSVEIEELEMENGWRRNARRKIIFNTVKVYLPAMYCCYPWPSRAWNCSNHISQIYIRLLVRKSLAAYDLALLTVFVVKKLNEVHLYSFIVPTYFVATWMASQLLWSIMEACIRHGSSIFLVWAASFRDVRPCSLYPLRLHFIQRILGWPALIGLFVLL